MKNRKDTVDKRNEYKKERRYNEMKERMYLRTKDSSVFLIQCLFCFLQSFANHLSMAQFVLWATIQETQPDFLRTRWRSLSCNINLSYFRLVSYSRSLPDTLCFFLTTICMHHYLQDSCHIFTPLFISFTLSHFINGFASYFSKRMNSGLHRFEFTALRVECL
jgi:hypothetical protein